MDRDLWRPEAPQSYSFLDPHYDVVSGAARVIAQIVVQAEFFNLSGLEKRNRFIRPVDANPSIRGLTFVVKEYTHSVSTCAP